MKFKEYITEDRFAYHDLKINYLPKAKKNGKEKTNFLELVRKAHRLGHITKMEADELTMLAEGVSGKTLETLINMVAIARRPEEVENTFEIINRAEKNKLILPVQAKRMRKELEGIRSSL